MNFLTADDMSAILAVKLRKRLGFGMWTKLHLTGMHVEGKVRFFFSVVTSHRHILTHSLDTLYTLVGVGWSEVPS